MSASSSTRSAARSTGCSFADALPTPTFGTGGILWASLTLALLTVPVVIVATEEGLAACRAACAKRRWRSARRSSRPRWRVVLPAVLPSILTGLILAMARAAGEVAPLMITGVVKLAPALPLDGFFPFFHFDRKFMHLGFHIYDVGFQSPNVDAARPMVFTTTMLLLLIVSAPQPDGDHARNRLRKRLADVGSMRRGMRAMEDRMDDEITEPGTRAGARPGRAPTSGPDASARGVGAADVDRSSESDFELRREAARCRTSTLDIPERRVTAFIGPPAAASRRCSAASTA